MKHLLLLGAGQAHLQLLASLARQALAGTEITLVSPFEQSVQFARLADFVAGAKRRDQCTFQVQDLLSGSPIRWLRRHVTGLDAERRTVELDDGSSLGYHWLSINTGPVHDRVRLESELPGSRQNALFVRPTEAFLDLWPQVCELASKRSLRVAVIGGGGGGIELAFAMAHRLPHASITLLSGNRGLAPSLSEALLQRIRQALLKRHINVIQTRATAIEPGTVHLGNGARLGCDVPVVAIGAQAPAWLSDSGLARDEAGFVAVNECHRSVSHSSVFATGDVCSRVDGQGQRNGYYAAQSGATLINQLRAVTAGIEAAPIGLRSPRLQLLTCGHRYAIGQWRELTFEGRWVWHLKDQLARAALRSALRPSAL